MTPPAAPLVVASVLHWNAPAKTLECIVALRKLGAPNLQVVVTDNASRDDDAGLFEAAGAAVLRNAENLGFAAGHECALREAQRRGADAIWLVNNDAVVEPGALASLLDAWREHGDGLFGGLPLRRAGDGTVRIDLPEKFLRVDAAPKAFRRDRPLRFDATWQSRAPFRVGAISGVSMLLPLRVVRAIGWLDPAWFMYCEEIDYCWRARRAGIASWLVPASRAWHAGSASQRGRPRVAHVLDYYRTRNEIELARRHAVRGMAMIVAGKKFARALKTAVASPRRALWIGRGFVDGARGAMGRRHLPDRYL